MFSDPQLAKGQEFPPLPFEDPEWQQLTKSLNAHIDPASLDDKLTQYTRYAVGWVEHLPDYHDAFHDEHMRDSELFTLLSRAGLLSAIDPKTPQHDYALVDGGNSNRYDIRLAHAQRLQGDGKLVVPHLVVFGGQCPRTDRFDNLDALVRRAQNVDGKLDTWATKWIKDELQRDDVRDDIWSRPFATERELAFLSLLTLYKGQLRHVTTIPRPDAASVRIHPSIPVASTAADVFMLGDQTITVLNAPARWREHAGRKLPVEQARPNGRSCFKEWLALHRPPKGSRVILLTHQPNIYRSWLDIIIKAKEEGRSDLCITAAGAPLESEATVGDVLEGLGNLIINNYNMYKEGGIDIPPTTPFVMHPRVIKK